ncbi:MAG TPA: Hsp33 family molecular chaperone HslO [Pelovirga sp.]|nr:Hsp33 family molecular chaperone HslO [Pelovirga sp.]
MKESSEADTLPQDTLWRVVSADKCFRGLVAVTTQTVTDICAKQQTDLTATVALGRLLTGGALMAGLLKGRQRLSLAIEGNGPIGRMTVEADAQGRLRGTIRNPLPGLPPHDDKFDVAGAIGRAGFLTVTKDLGLKKPYQSMVQLQTSEIGEDLAWYLSSSEQVPSCLGLGVEFNRSGNIAAAGGFLIQTLPPELPQKIDTVVDRIERLPPISSMLREKVTPPEILKRIFANETFATCESIPLVFFCPCSRDQIEQMLIGLGRAELLSIAQQEPTTSVRCEYCCTEYVFEAEKLHRLAQQ